jgi:hypothetical protein
MKTKLRMTQSQHELLERHLFPGDGLEAVAVALCGRRNGKNEHILTVLKIEPIPYQDCKVRTPIRVTWSTERLVPLLLEAAKKDLAILKIHSHPGGYESFSATDDESDIDLFNSIYGWTDSNSPHCSAVMLPGGRLFGRTIQADGAFSPLESILVPGDDLRIWMSQEGVKLPAFVQRHAQLFGSGTTQRVRGMSAAVIGCSGTGSPLIEQLARLGFGRLVLLDPDVIEMKNLNRIINSSLEDAYLQRPKVQVIASAIARMGFGTEVEIIADSLLTARAVKAVASCDVVFGCMDSVEGRHVLNRLCAYYTLPYFDVGVKLKADGLGGIEEACGAVHYVRPDGSNLLDRHVYTFDQLRSEGLKRTDPEAYKEQIKAGYIHGVEEDRPAVISINTQMASIAVNELLARLHPYRLDPNSESAIVRVSFVDGTTYRQPDGVSGGLFTKVIGRGDIEPLLNMPELGAIRGDQ